MNIVEKKFQVIHVGADFMSEEYRKKLESDGYELIHTETLLGKYPVSYTFRLKENKADAS